MIDLDKLEGDLKANKLKNVYVFCGLDEILIKEAISKIISKTIDPMFKDLNMVKYDAIDLDFNTFMNACETLPFMTEKRAVVIARANFFKDKCDSESKSFYEKAKSYFENPPESTVLIAYFLLNDKRDRANKVRKLLALEKKGCTIVSVEKLKGVRLYSRIEQIFKSKGKDIGKIELRYFSELVHSNFDIIEREIDKLVNYTVGREITKADIDMMKQGNSEDDIFDLIDLISLKKPSKAIDLMNELFNKGEEPLSVLRLVQGQFQKLYTIKNAVNAGMRTEEVAREMGLPNFIVDKLSKQSNGFSDVVIKKALSLSLETEKNLKSRSNLNRRTEMELMVINILV
ncbi:DNA polymerase III subunit delta [uncultured Clostridium sp.]|uniref:DNA polymerase III subunit delta n=1 Tax=uncultured Clostridium sp. TaxID=59620 RepID=UPI002603A6C7|nr:DNA polymerase III subunit delta [uncultured Clostridium sp.]